MATGMVRQYPLPTTVPQQPHAFFRRHPSDPNPTQRSDLAVPIPPPSSIPAHDDVKRSSNSSRRSQEQSRSSFQYARPLRRTNSNPPHPSSRDDNETTGGSSEHMLRRKTPNGILNAAYDGTSVEQTERPHAVKHILLPVSDQMTGDMLGSPSASLRDVPLRPHAQSFDPIFSNGYQADRLPSSMWRNTDVQKAWLPQPHLPQIDSMLNQMPMPNANFQYQQVGHHPFAFMPPFPQASFGPTASNDPGPFGPYWPNGTFVPYRPAPIRDPRYYPQQSGMWSPHAMPLDSGMANGQWVQTTNPYLDMSNLNLSNRQGFPQPPMTIQQPSPIGSSYMSNHYSDGQRPLEADPFSNIRHDTSFQRPPQYRYDSQNSGFDSGLESGQTTPTPLSYQNIPAILAEFGPGSSNAELREQVFSWAHSIYIDLLKHLHETRRRGHHSHHGSRHHSSGPNIYPRPPRQPSCDFTSTSRNRSSSNVDVYPQHGSQPNERRPNIHPARTSSMHHHLSRPFIARQIDVSSPWQPPNPSPLSHFDPRADNRHPQLRRTTGSLTGPSYNAMVRADANPTTSATEALDLLTELCAESRWKWVDGLLLGGCLAYALGDYSKASEWYSKILVLDPKHVEAMSNLAATMLATQRKHEAEKYWSQAVKLRPSYFEAVEHLIGLLCGDHRGKEAVVVIEYVQKSLHISRVDSTATSDHRSETSSSVSESPSLEADNPVFEFERDGESKDYNEMPGSSQPGFGSSGYSVAGADNGRILQLLHAKGNMLYAMGDNMGAAKAFEEAVMVGLGRQYGGLDGLIKHILRTVSVVVGPSERSPVMDPILLTPLQALETAKLCFPNYGGLPGLKNIPKEGQARKAVISTTSNSLLSLAKIFQDAMASSSSKFAATKASYGVREILALYYLSLSLQPSPSTANNVGILLASVQQIAPQRPASTDQKQVYPGVTPGSGTHLALLYYNYGLHLDQKHAHLYTNYGSLLKDIGQLQWAIQMYEQAVKCDPNFDIALANLANAVKDTGRIADAITYYRRAVKANPDFAEAVCGLANALNSVCGWQGRGGIATRDGSYDRWHVNEDNMPVDARRPGVQSSGWIKRVVELVEKQLSDGEEWGKGVVTSSFIEAILQFLPRSYQATQNGRERLDSVTTALQDWSGHKWEGARVVRLVERIIKRLTWQWYQDKHVRHQERPANNYKRPRLPTTLTIPAAPTVLPFHTFTCPMSAKQIRHISQRNGLRISCSTLKAPWLPSTVCRPPPPPQPVLKVGYVSSDFNNHPLAHLMQSVFGLHDRRRVEAFCYATTASDNSVHRKQIEEQSPHFYDATTWSADKLIKKIVDDGIHILVNLNGYTRGARNEIFAARPAPIQMSFMGFAGTLGAEWCDYLLADDTAIPVDTLRPWRRNVDIEDQIEDELASAENEHWIYGENIIFCRDTFFCCDHRQSAPDVTEKQLSWDEEQSRRWKMRKELFPTLADDAVIFGNFNQLYKIEPTTFRTWLRILAQVPKAVLWLLRFPDLGEQYLKQTAEKWATPEVAARVMFTDVAPKHMHISRARICDLFLDTPECNAHTTAADVLWSGTPLLTLPRYKYKMCSRMAASILKGALPKGHEGARAATELIAEDEEDYENKAIALGNALTYDRHRPVGRLGELRKLLYESRWTSALFDTKRWVRDLEEAYGIAWQRWVDGKGGDIWLKDTRRNAHDKSGHVG